MWLSSRGIMGLLIRWGRMVMLWLVVDLEIERPRLRKIKSRMVSRTKSHDIVLSTSEWPYSLSASLWPESYYPSIR